jgi:anti-sigma B factor antagonist
MLMSPLLTIAVSDRSDPIVVTLTGELDIAGQGAFESAILPTWDIPAAGILLDFSGLTFMDSTGLSSVIRVHKRCVHENRSLEVLASEPVLRVFRITGLTGVLSAKEAQTA